MSDMDNYDGPFLIANSEPKAWSVMNETAVLTMSKDGKTTKLEVKPGFLPMQPI